MTSALLPQDSVSVELSNDAKSYLFVIELKFNNSDINDLIKQGKAEFSCEYECAKTMLRCCKKTDKNKFEIQIPRHSINGPNQFQLFCFS